MLKDKLKEFNRLTIWPLFPNKELHSIFHKISVKSMRNFLLKSQKIIATWTTLLTILSTWKYCISYWIGSVCWNNRLKRCCFYRRFKDLWSLSSQSIRYWEKRWNPISLLYKKWSIPHRISRESWVTHWFKENLSSFYILL